MIDKTTKVVIGIAVILLVVLVGMMIFSSDPGVTGNVVNTGSSSKFIEFGFVGPLTGDVASIGQQNKAAIEMAVEEINSKGGINGKKIKMIYEDGKCDAKSAANSGNKLINVDGVKFIIGGECSGETMAIAPMAEQNKVLLISPVSSSPAITTAGDYIFRDYITDNDAGRVLAQKMYNDLGYRKVAVMWSINDYSEGLSGVFRENFEKLGGQVVFQEKFEQGASDLRTPLSKLKTTDAEAIVFIEYTAGSITFYNQRKELGITLPIFGTDTLTDPEIVKAVGNRADGTRYVLAKDSYSQEFKDKMKEHTGGDTVLMGTPQAYDAVYILKNAIEKVGEDPTKVKDYLYDMPAFYGESGKVQFDENGDLKESEFVMWEIKNGKHVLIG